MAKQNKKSFSKWLNKLQQESWQLELLISGLVIFALLESLTHFPHFYALLEELTNNESAEIYIVALILAVGILHARSAIYQTTSFNDSSLFSFLKCHFGF